MTQDIIISHPSAEAVQFFKNWEKRKHEQQKKLAAKDTCTFEIKV